MSEFKHSGTFYGADFNESERSVTPLELRVTGGKSIFTVSKQTMDLIISNPHIDWTSAFKSLVERKVSEPKDWIEVENFINEARRQLDSRGTDPKGIEIVVEPPFEVGDVVLANQDGRFGIGTLSQCLIIYNGMPYRVRAIIKEVDCNSGWKVYVEGQSGGCDASKFRKDFK